MKILITLLLVSLSSTSLLAQDIAVNLGSPAGQSYVSGDTYTGSYTFNTAYDPSNVLNPNWGGTITESSTWNGTGFAGQNTFVPSGEFDDTLLVNGNGGWGFQGGSGNTTVIDLDFTGMTNGYLPSGTWLAVMDTDISGEELTLSSSASGAWLTTVATGDYTDPVDTSTVPPGITFNFLPSSYTFAGNGTDYSSGFRLMQTTQNLTSLKISGQHNSFNGGVHAFNIWAPTVPVPEPSSGLLAALAGTLALLRRRR